MRLSFIFFTTGSHINPTMSCACKFRKTRKHLKGYFKTFKFDES